MRTVYVVTHTEAQHHVDHLVGGWHDSSLTVRGKQQAQQVADRLYRQIENQSVQIFSSDLSRAAQTAAVIAAVLGATPVSLSDLREISYGDAEGRPEGWLRERLVPAPDANRLDHRSIAQGETRREFATRMYRAMDHVLQSATETQIIVTHSFAVTFLVAAWMRIPAAETGYMHLRAPSGSITTLEEDDYWRNRAVLSLGDTTHLHG